MHKNNLTVAICSVPRSGSTLLARSLEMTELLGRPREYFNELTHPEYRDLHQKDIVDYIHNLRETTCSSNGNWGFKIHYRQMQSLLLRLPKKLNIKCFKSFMDAFFPNHRIIFISRKDKVRQAISASIADQTQVFNIDTNEEFDPSQYAQRLIYRPMRINRRVKRFAEEEANWFQEMEKFPGGFQKVWYEDLYESYESEVCRTLKYLDCLDDVNPNIFQIQPLHRLSNEINEVWYQKYMSRYNKKNIFQKIFSKKR